MKKLEMHTVLQLSVETISIKQVLLGLKLIFVTLSFTLGMMGDVSASAGTSAEYAREQLDSHWARFKTWQIRAGLSRDNLAPGKPDSSQRLTS